MGAAGRALLGLLDTGVKLPFAVAADVRDRVRRRILTARAVGEMAVGIGVRQLEARLGRGAAVPAAANPEPTPEAAAPNDEPAPADDDAAADDLPIAGYESLAASQVVAMLPALSGDDLAAVERFEQANRRRRTVLGKIDQLQRA